MLLPILVAAASGQPNIFLRLARRFTKQRRRRCYCVGGSLGGRRGAGGGAAGSARGVSAGSSPAPFGAMVVVMVDGWVLEAEGLSKQFGTKLAVDGVSLKLKPGEIVGLLGPNGAGKTTTLKILLGMLRPTRGRALVLGLDCT